MRKKYIRATRIFVKEKVVGNNGEDLFPVYLETKRTYTFIFLDKKELQNLSIAIDLLLTGYTEWNEDDKHEQKK